MIPHNSDLSNFSCETDVIQHGDDGRGGIPSGGFFDVSPELLRRLTDPWAVTFQWKRIAAFAPFCTNPILGWHRHTARVSEKSPFI
jgi:hypothetical protein